jgi:hypothetical protein
MSDDTFDRDLDSIAGSIPGMPGSYAQLQSLLQSLPSALPPDVRSAITGQVNAAEPGTTQAQIASSMTGQAPGSESGASLGVVSEIYYANANLLNNPIMAAMDTSGAAVAVGAVASYFADDWQIKYTLNSGAAPTITVALNDTRFAPNGFHPFNSHQPYIGFSAPLGASDATISIFPANSWQQFFDTELNYLTAAFKTWGGGFNVDANTTVFQTWVEMWDTNGAGALLGSSPVINWMDPAIAASDSVFRQTVAVVSASVAAFAYQPRLMIRIAKNSAGGSEFMNFGEAVMALASTQSPPPYSPIIARWIPSFLRAKNPGDAQSRFEAGINNEGQETATTFPQVGFGAGGGATKDIRIRRTGSAILRIENPNGPARASLELVAGASPGAAPANTGRLWWNTATKTLFQIDDAGVATDLAAGGGAAFAAPTILLGTAAAAGAAATVIRSDATIVAFDGTVPLGVDATAAAAGAATLAAKNDHRHQLGAHGAGQHTDITRTIWLGATAGKIDTATLATLGATPDITPVIAYADAATQGAMWTFLTPSDWASGALSIQPVWSPGATDAVAHTVRWAYITKLAGAGTTITAAGTTVTWTGASAARTVGVVVYDTITSTTITPAAAGDVIRLTVRRVGADAADTYVGVVNLVGLIVTYTANQ